PRTQSRQRPIIYPLSTFLKLAGRRHNAAPAALMPDRSTVESVLGIACAVAPLLALVMLPLPANPLLAIGQAGDLLVIVSLLSIQPLTSALLGLRGGGQASLRGAQDLGRLLTGLLPALIAVAARVEVWGAGSLRMTALSAAPETGAQTLVRILSGAVLLLALPWWLHSDNRTSSLGGAGSYAGRRLQAVALGAFWALLVLPTPGDQAWALALYTVGTLVASLAMRLIPERMLPIRRERDRANLVWSTALPVATIALLVSFWWGGL
ncbi:MAG: hypothetical protein ABIO92_07360, partial [Chloroflexia bacterium]